MENARIIKLLLRIQKSIDKHDTSKKRNLYNKVLAKLRYYNRKSLMKLDEMIADDIIEFVGKYKNVPEDYNISRTRKREFVLSRQISMVLIKNNTKMALEKIGSLFSNKDHATVLHALKTVNNLTDTDKEFKEDFEDIVRILKLNYIPYSSKKVY